MKAKEYVKKYNLAESDVKFSHGDFVTDLSSDMLATIEFLKESKQLNYTRFESVINETKQKFDSIVAQSKVKQDVWDGIWKFFYASFVVKLKEKMFGDYLRRKQARRMQREAEDYGFLGMDFAEAFFREAFRNYISQTVFARQVECFAKLGLEANCTAEDVKKRFRELAIVHHPDKGGSQPEFVAISEAKNKCLAYIEKSNIEKSYA